MLTPDLMTPVGQDDRRPSSRHAEAERRLIAAERQFRDRLDHRPDPWTAAQIASTLLQDEPITVVLESQLPRPMESTISAISLTVRPAGSSVRHRYVVIRTSSTWYRDHLCLHELGHHLGGIYGVNPDPAAALRQVLPDLHESPALAAVEHVVACKGRHSGDEEEQLIERFAAAVGAHGASLARTAPPPTSAGDPQALRMLLAALGQPVVP